MCALCDRDGRVREEEKANLLGAAERALQFAQLSKGFANGTLNPHSNDATKMVELSKFLLKDVVEWI